MVDNGVIRTSAWLFALSLPLKLHEHPRNLLCFASEKVMVDSSGGVERLQSLTTSFPHPEHVECIVCHHVTMSFMVAVPDIGYGFSVAGAS